MKSKMFTSVLATVAVSYLAFRKNIPGRVNSRSKFQQKRRTTPLYVNPDESSNLFI
ncbi:MAG: hypothetical protein WBA74_01895 [Cyclobacteriaceae bacterium]